MSDSQEEKIKRLRKIRDVTGVSQAKMAILFGIKQPNLSAIENQKDNRIIPYGIDYILESELNISREWFNYGIGEMFVQDSSNENILKEHDPVLDVDSLRKKK